MPSPLAGNSCPYVHELHPLLAPDGCEALLGATRSLAMPAIAGVAINCGEQADPACLLWLRSLSFHREQSCYRHRQRYCHQLIKHSGCKVETQVMARARI
jgi:hypothetical protein